MPSDAVETTTAFSFPRYTTAELRADAAVHAVAVSAGAAGAVWLPAAAASAGAPALDLVSLLVYTAGLAAMFSVSAAYHLTPAGPTKALLRRIDHATIFLMIAGTYTPLSLARIGGDTGAGLAIAVWALALAGATVKLAWPHRFERTALAAYLGLGWAIVVMAEPLARSVSSTALLLIAAGGLVYTIGVLIHLSRMPFCNAIWHAFVLAGAGCHFAAMTVEFTA